MCSAIGYLNRYFGRTMDYEHSFGEKIIVTPREFLPIGESKNRYAVMGIGVLAEGTPLYFEGVNEWGLAAAALNFPGCAVYLEEEVRGKELNLSPGELISFILGFCRNVHEARAALTNIRIVSKIKCGKDPAPLHWIFYDKNECIVVEPLATGLSVKENPISVMTNAPDLSYHMTRLSDYMSLTPTSPKNNLTECDLPRYSRGTGALGLPGDFSSSSRFVRAVFVKENTLVCNENATPLCEISAFFHIMDSVSIPLGCVITDEGNPVSTIYTSCIDMENLVYYFKSYDCSNLRAIRFNNELYTSGDFEIFDMHFPEKTISLN